MIEDLDPKASKTLDKGRCPDCGSKAFLQGPRGGLSVNIKCDGCGAEFNLTPGPFTNERISRGAATKKPELRVIQDGPKLPGWVILLCAIAIIIVVLAIGMTL